MKGGLCILRVFDLFYILKVRALLQIAGQLIGIILSYLHIPFSTHCDIKFSDTYGE